MNTQTVKTHIVAIGRVDAEGVRFDRIDEDFFPVTAYELSEARQMWRDLEAKWGSEGYALYFTGHDVDECWNDTQRAGWLEAERNWHAVLGNIPAYPVEEEPEEPVDDWAERAAKWTDQISF